MGYLTNKTVIVPYDWSDFSKRALDSALEMAEDSTRLHVIHVVEPTATMISFDPAMPISPSYDQERLEKALEHLKKMFGAGKYKPFQFHCKIGDPGSEIVDLAKSLRANLIVMPSHGRTGLKRLFLGSVAERVLRLANCPVLILRD